ncbi:MAG: RDD family protein [Jatrophihabitantaceae bacterium]
MPAPTVEPQAFRGQRLGLPESGHASLASPGARIGAWIVDSVLSALAAALFVQVLHHGHHRGLADRLPGYWSLIPFALDYVLGMLFAGRTMGMYLFGLRIIRVDRNAAVDPWRALLRTLLLMLLVPAVVFDKDGRGLHDRYTDTAVVRA